MFDMTHEELITKVAIALLNSANDELGLPPFDSIEGYPEAAIYIRNARAAVAAIGEAIGGKALETLAAPPA